MQLLRLPEYISSLTFLSSQSEQMMSYVEEPINRRSDYVDHASACDAICVE